MKKTRLKYLGFMLGVFLLLLGWFISLMGNIAFFDNLLYQAIDKIGKNMSGLGVVLIFAGIVFFAILSAKEAKVESAEPAEYENDESNPCNYTEQNAYKVKNSILVTAAFGSLSILTTLLSASSLFNGAKLWFMWIILIFALFSSQYHIRKSVRQIKWLLLYNQNQFEMPMIAEVFYIDMENDLSIALHVLNNGKTLVLFDNYLLNDIETKKFEDEFARYIGVKVLRDDRECFIIKSSQQDVVKKAVGFLQVKSKEWVEWC